MRTFLHISHEHNTRNKKKACYKLPSPRTDLGKRSTKFFGVKIWSKIDEETKNIENIGTFSVKIKEDILKNYLDSVF